MIHSQSITIIDSNFIISRRFQVEHIQNKFDMIVLAYFRIVKNGFRKISTRIQFEIIIGLIYIVILK
jgi:hypothetical protein